MKINTENFYIDLGFTVYDGTLKTLPKSSNMRVFVLLFDSDKLQEFQTKIEFQKMYWYDNVDAHKVRISIGDAWAEAPTRKDIKHYPKAG